MQNSAIHKRTLLHRDLARNYFKTNVQTTVACDPENPFNRRLPDGAASRLKMYYRNTRPEGIKTYSIRKPLAEDDCNVLKSYVPGGDWFNIPGILEKTNGFPIFYAPTNAFFYLMVKTTGWPHPDDFFWLLEDHLKLPPDLYDRPTSLIFYMDPQYNNAIENFRLLNRDLFNWVLPFIEAVFPRRFRDDLRALFNTALLLEVDILAYFRTLPLGRHLSWADHVSGKAIENDLYAPIITPDRGTHRHRIIAWAPNAIIG